jgi:hypothetical protein
MNKRNNNNYERVERKTHRLLRGYLPWLGETCYQARTMQCMPVITQHDVNTQKQY